MKKHLVYLALLILAAVLLGTQLPTQSVEARNPTSPPPNDVAVTAVGSDIDPEAMAALTRMGTYLRSIKAFQVEAVTTRDEVLDSGQQIQFDSKVNFLVRMPDRLRIEVENVRQHRLYLYDGKDFTVWAERANYYATVPAPPTVGKLAGEVDDKYGIQIPLEDLFYWGTPQSKEKDITGAIDVGPSEVGGVTCEHYAFRQKGLDWQAWIQMGDFPLPRKLVITTLTDESRPQYSSVLTWNLAPSFNDAAFEFAPPKDAHKIAIAEESAPAGAEK
jgi:hypothetical protein